MNQYKFKSEQHTYRYGKKSKIRWWFWGLLLVAIGVLFLPWTQNIKAKGRVTTLYQNQRPQEIHSIISGKIIKWNIKEGDYVKKGDTLLQLAEVKDEYFDPNLVGRTENQIAAKQRKISSYEQKASAYANQIPALESQRDFKLNQLANKRLQVQNKISADQAELKAAQVELDIASDILRRSQEMVSEGVLSQIELDKRNNSFQKANATVTEKRNKLEISQRELENIELDYFTVSQEYSEKIFKAQAERSSSMAEAANTASDIEKLNIQATNYRVRAGNYYIVAPQDGQVIKVKNAGINEIVKDGEMLMEVVPDVKNFAVEMFIDPTDQVLVDTGQEVRFIFDGFPAIVFSGWPQASYGTFLGKVKTIETNAQKDGTFRMLVVPTADKPWPPSLKLGTVASGFALLKDVKVWFELWRNINGFPPEYFKPITEAEKSKK